MPPSISSPASERGASLTTTSSPVLEPIIFMLKQTRRFCGGRHRNAGLIGCVVAVVFIVMDSSKISVCETPTSTVPHIISFDATNNAKNGGPNNYEGYRDNVATTISSSNSTQYTWVGNHFIPPPNVPTFTPKQFLSYFKNRNTLFIGDSLARRSWATLSAMMTGEDLDNVGVDEMDNPTIIDFDKLKNVPDQKCTNQNRTLMPSIYCRNLGVGGGKGRFDFMRHNCVVGIMFTFFMEKINPNITIERKYDATAADFLQDYDLVVIAMGIWEALRSELCQLSIASNYTEKLVVFMDSLAEMTSENLQVAIRTPGFSQDHKGDAVMWSMVDYIKQFSNNHPSINMTVVDWGTVISKRSYGEERIEGDMKPHYGLEARLLFAQQLLHELLAEDYRREGRMTL